LHTRTGYEVSPIGPLIKTSGIDERIHFASENLENQVEVKEKLIYMPPLLQAYRSE
jgi:hypothetical protein